MRNNNDGLLKTIIWMVIGYLIYDRFIKGWIDRGGADNFLRKIGGFKNKKVIDISPEIKAEFKPDIEYEEI